jgi:hypothetical protein
MFVPLYAGLRVGEKSIMGCQCAKRFRTPQRRDLRCGTASKKSPDAIGRANGKSLIVPRASMRSFSR